MGVAALVGLCVGVTPVGMSCADMTPVGNDIPGLSYLADVVLSG